MPADKPGRWSWPRPRARPCGTRPARSGHPLGAGAPGRRAAGNDTRLFEHRPDPGSGRYRADVRPELGPGSDLRSSTGPLGRGNPTPVECVGHRPNHPVLLGLFSLVTLLANCLHARGLLRAQACAWYQKQAPTFSDALATIRRYLWTETIFDNSPKDTVLLKIPRHQIHIWQEALAWAT